MRWKPLIVVANCLFLAACVDSNDNNDNSNDNPNSNNLNNNNVVTPYCGDGEVQSGEQCDDGGQNSDTTPNACRSDCTLPVCGDGVADDQHGEVCDDGNQLEDDGCSADCKTHREIVGLGIDAFAYDIARDNNDVLHIIWKPQSPVNELFHYGRIVNGQIADEGEIPGTGGALGRGYRPRLAVSPDGSLVHFSWANTGRHEIFHAYRVNGQWSHESIYVAPDGCVPGGSCVTLPVSGIDAQGVVHIIAVTYSYPSPQNTRIRYWRKQLDGGWLNQAETLFGPVGDDWRSTAMFTDRNGGIHAAWKRFPSPGRYVYVASGGQLQTSNIIDIPPPQGRNHVGMGDLYVTDGGDVHTAYRGDAGGGGASIWHTVKPSGQAQFSTPCSEVGPVLQVEGPVIEHNPWPALGVDPSGRILVAWSENAESTPGIVSDVFLSIRNAGAWAYEHFDNDANQHQYSKVAIAVTSESTYLYWRTSTSNPELMQARFTYAQ